MKARLEVARDLLSDEGVIFCSIDDNMQAELKILFDEVFGKENFVATFIWRKKNTGGGSDKKTIEVETEYVLCYSKSINDDLFIGQDIDSESFSLSDKYEKERGKYKLTDLDHVCSSSSFQYQTSLDYEITAPDGNKFKNYRNILKPKSYRYTLGLPLFN
jgi:adenine-specific DNA-methyltransferase